MAVYDGYCEGFDQFDRWDLDKVDACLKVIDTDITLAICANCDSSSGSVVGHEVFPDVVRSDDLNGTLSTVSQTRTISEESTDIVRRKGDLLSNRILEDLPEHVIDNQSIELCILARILDYDIEVEHITVHDLSVLSVVSEVRNTRLHSHRVHADIIPIFRLEDMESVIGCSVLEERLHAHKIDFNIVFAVWHLNEFKHGTGGAKGIT